MSKILQLKEFTNGNGEVFIQFEELVGSGMNWLAPSRILDLDIVSYLKLLKNDFEADLRIYKKDGKVSFVGYSWKSLVMARKYKSYVNRILREKKITIKFFEEEC